MATAVIGTQNRTLNAAMDVDAMVDRRNRLVRAGEITKENGQGGYTIFGRLVELRYELSTDHPKAPTHLMPDVRGLVVDWGTPKNGPLLGKSRGEDELLVISTVNALPEIPDPTFQQQVFVEYDGNRIPLASIPPDMRADLKNADGSKVLGTDQPITRPRMIAQHFVDHSAGTVGRFLVVRPLTEGLVKLVGLPQLLKVYFQAKGQSQAGFFLDPATGEAHFLGGKIVF